MLCFAAGLPTQVGAVYDTVYAGAPVVDNDDYIYSDGDSNQEAMDNDWPLQWQIRNELNPCQHFELNRCAR